MSAYPCEFCGEGHPVEDCPMVVHNIAEQVEEASGYCAMSGCVLPPHTEGAHRRRDGSWFVKPTPWRCHCPPERFLHLESCPEFFPGGLRKSNAN